MPSVPPAASSTADTPRTARGDATPPVGRGGLLHRLGLHTRELRAWAMYDWAISAVQTTTMVAVFPIFFIQVAGAEAGMTRSQVWWSTSNSISIAIVALLSPILGAVADYAAAKKRFLLLFQLVGVMACAAMWLIGRGDLLLASVLFILVGVGAAGATVFYESLLPHLAREEETDRASTAAYAIGYLGGGVLLALNFAWILKPGLFGLPSGEGLTPEQRTLPTRVALVSVALWWMGFSLFLFRRVPEPPVRLDPNEAAGRNPVRMAFVRLVETFHELRQFKQAFLLLIAFLVYNDGVNTIQKMATAYGTELHIDRVALIGAILVVQFVGIPATFAFGALAGWIGAKRSVMLALVVYCIISVLGYFMQTATHFFMLAGLVGLVQGGSQALSRSMFARMIPQHKSGEFFGFYSIFNKFAGIFGPLLFGGTVAATGSSRNAILSVISFFVVGMVILAFVNVEAGERAARAAEAEARRAA
jgi:MFS transporter, UMF1 family